MKLPTNRIATHLGAFLLEQIEELGLTVNGLARDIVNFWTPLNAPLPSCTPAWTVNFVGSGRHGCSISSFYQTLFLKMIKDLPQDQWSNIIDRVIQDIRRGKTRGKKRFSLEFSLKNIIEDLEKST